MKEYKWKQRITIYGFVLCLVSMMVLIVISPKETVSSAERRRLAEKPELTTKNLIDKSFMDDTEKYLLDHFPFRDKLRRIKAYFAYDVLQQKENNDIYVVNGHAAKLEYPLNEASIKRLAVKMKGLRQQYFPEQTAWYAIVPDKNYFLAEQNGFPSIDYERMGTLLSQELRVDNAPDTTFRFMDIVSGLTIEDYYRTDTHWRQECILDVARCVGDMLGVGEALSFSDSQSTFIENEIKNFYGVYYGQAALPMEPDTIVYLTSEVTDAARVWSLEENMQSGKNTKTVLLPDEEGAVWKSVYQTEKLADSKSLDKYDVFVGGASSLQIIRSPKAATQKRLILFRDSYTSSLAPLLLEAYKEIVLIDLRYIDSMRIGTYVDFAEADILFLYNTSIINHSEMLK
ncbi:hypothetical protein IMSAGC011_00867 [Lachnospiraceae bacterium]|nr:hypothetical protein IMSAGC011_00867 [Lachnospiraceae bacterium]